VPNARITNVIIVAIHILAFLHTIWTRYLDVNKFGKSNVTHLVLAPSQSYCSSPPRYSNCACHFKFSQIKLTTRYFTAHAVTGSRPNSSLSCYILIETERRSVRPRY